METLERRYGFGDFEPVVVAHTAGMGRDEWLEHRTKGIGGSDAAPIAGLSRWCSPWEVFQDKTGRLPDKETTEQMEWGNKLEAVVGDEFALRTGLDVRHEPVLLAHPEYPWMLANVDRFVGDDAILECKTTDARRVQEWDDGPPFEAALQSNHYLAVTGRRRAYVACLIGGNKFAWHPLERDEELIEQIIELERDFWENHVLTDTAPDITERRTDREALSRMFKGVSESQTLLPPKAVDLLDERRRLKAAGKVITEDVTRLENQIKEMLGDNEIGLDAEGNVIVTWKRSAPMRLQQDEFKTNHPDLAAKYTRACPERRFYQPKPRKAKSA